MGQPASPPAHPLPFLCPQVRELLVDGATKLKWRSEELNFQQARTWLGRPATEKVEGWSTQVGGGRVCPCPLLCLVGLVPLALQAVE